MKVYFKNGWGLSHISFLGIYKGGVFTPMATHRSPSLDLVAIKHQSSLAEVFLSEQKHPEINPGLIVFSAECALHSLLGENVDTITHENAVPSRHGVYRRLAETIEFLHFHLCHRFVLTMALPITLPANIDPVELLLQNVT
jgi:hypothetical protein